MNRFLPAFALGKVACTFAFTFVLFLLSVSLSAQNNYIGASGGAWHVDANWSSGLMPITTDNVVIPAATSVVVGAGNPTIQIVDLTLNAGSGLTLSDANFTATGTSTLAGSITDNTALGSNQFNGAATTTANFSINGNQAFRFCNTFTVAVATTFTNNCTSKINSPINFYNPAFAAGPAPGIIMATPTPMGGFGGLTIQGYLIPGAASSNFVNGTNAVLTLNLNPSAFNGCTRQPMTLTAFPNNGAITTIGGFDATASGNMVRYYNTSLGADLRDCNYSKLRVDLSGNSQFFRIGSISNVDKTISDSLIINTGRLNLTNSVAGGTRKLIIGSSANAVFNNGTASPTLRTNVSVATALIVLEVQGTLIRQTNTNNEFGANNAGASVVFKSGSFYLHRSNGQDVIKGITSGVVTWEAGSTCQIDGTVLQVTTTAIPGVLGQIFSNFTWNVTNQNASLNVRMRGGSSMFLSNIAGKLTVNSTGSGTFAFSDDNGPNLTQTIGSFEQNGGIFFLNNGANNGATNTLNILGDFNQTAGTITNNIGNAGARGVIQMGGTAGPQTFTANGTLDQLFSIVINNTSGTPNVTLGSNVSTTGLNRLTNLVLTNGNLVFGGTARTFTVRGNISGTGGIDMSGAAHVLNAEAAVVFGSLTPGTNSTFVYDQNSAGQTVRLANYTNLTFSNQDKTLPAGTIGVAGTLNPGTATGHTVTGNTIEFNGATQNIPAFPNSGGYNNVSTNTSGTKSLTANVLVGGSLTLNDGVIALGGFNLTVAGNVVAGAAFSNTNMVRTNGIGALRKSGAAAANFEMIYPVGTASLYTPFEITSLAATVAAGVVSVRAVGSLNPNTTGSNALSKWWDVSTSGLSAITADAQFSYVNPTEVTGNQALYEGRYWDGLVWVVPTGTSAAGVNPFSTTGSSTLTGEWTAGEPSSFLPVITFTSTGGGGNWNNAGTWSPIGGPPTALDNVVISSGNPVTISANGAQCSNLTIQSGAILTAGTTTGHSFAAVSGIGTFRISTGTLPTADFSNFTSILGGTFEYLGGTYTLSSLANYRNLILSGTGTKTSGANMTINGNLTVNAGTGFDLSIGNHTLALTGAMNLQGSYASGSGLHTLSGTAQNITASSPKSIDNLEISGSYTQAVSTLTVSANLSGAGSLTLSAANILNLGGNASINTLNASAANTTVNYTQPSAGQNVVEGTYHNITYSNFNKVLPAGTITVNNTYSPGTALGHTVTGNSVVFNGPAGQNIPASQYNDISQGNTNSRIFDPINTIYIAGLFNPGTNSYTITGSTIEYNSNAIAQSVADLNAYNNLSFSGTAGIRLWNISGGTPRTVTIGGRLVISGNANFTVAGNNIAGDKIMSISNTAIDAVTLNSGATFSATNNPTINISGTLTNNGGSVNSSPNNAFIFSLTTSIYDHAFNGGAIANPTFNFGSLSTFRVSGVTTTMPTTNAFQAFGNFEWICPGQTAPAGFVVNSSGTRTYNNVSIKNTGTSHFLWAASNTYTHTISGNLTIDAGARSYGYAAVASGSATQNIAGNLLVNGTMELHNDNLGGGSFHSWIVTGNVIVGATGVIQRTSNTSAKIQMAGTTDRSITMTAGAQFPSGTLEINKTAGAKVTLGSNVSVPGLTFTSGNIEVTGGRIFTYTGAATPTRVSGYVAVAVGGTNQYRWSVPASTAIGTFDFHVGLIGAITGYRQIRVGGFTSPAGTPSVAIGFQNNPGTSPTGPASISSLPGIQSSRFFPELTFAGGTFGTGNLTLEADLTTDFYNGPISPVDLDIFKAPPVPQPWQFIGSGPFSGVNGSNTTVTQNGILFANGLNRLALGKSNLTDLGTPQFIAWTGLVSTDWSNPLNWSPTQVPSAFNQKIIIPNTTRKPVYSGVNSLYIRGLFIGLGSSATYNGDLGLDSAFSNSGTFNCPATFFNSGNGFGTGIFNFAGSNANHNLGSWEITNNSVSGVVVASSTQKFSLTGTMSLGPNARLNLNAAQTTLRSTAAGSARIAAIPSTATLSGISNFIWQRHVTSGIAGWYFLGTPVAGQTLSNWGDNFRILLPLSAPNITTAIADRATVFMYDGETATHTGALPREVNGWRIPTSTPTPVGKGFRVLLDRAPFLATVRVFDNAGSITTGDFNFAVTFNAAGFGGGGWNLLANPYPSAINWDAPTGPTSWTKTNCNNAIYVWNTAAGNYASYIGGVGVNGGSNIIAAGQAFMVRTNNLAPVLIARENVKSASNGTFLRTSTEQRLLTFKLTKEGSLASDENVIRIAEGATEDFDPMFDAFKLSGTDLNLAMLTNENTLSIHSIAQVDGQTNIPLRVKSSQTGSFALSFGKVSEFIPIGRMWLKDNFTYTLTPIEDETEVAFQITNDNYSQEDGRFELVFSVDNITWAARRNLEEVDFKLFPNPSANGEFTISSNNLIQGRLVIHDLAGKGVFFQELNEASNFSIVTHLPSGIYQVKVETKTGKRNQKLIIQ